MQALNREYAPTRDRLAMRGDERSPTPRTPSNEDRKDLYKRSKECENINTHSGVCLQCKWYETSYSYCQLYTRGKFVGKVKMKEQPTLQEQQVNFDKDTAQLRKDLKGFTEGW